MNPIPILPFAAIALALLSIPVPELRAQAAPRIEGPPGLPDGVTREQMWPAPSAEDWKRPVLIHWERTWDDAVAVARETNRPIMICINMDGEIASEHYAGVRYRDPDIAKLYEPYVCVIGSVYRHTPRDYDQAGRRVPCPRLGGVTCGEHIALETAVYPKYLDGKRISPRHILVEPDGTAKFDVYYTWDTATVFDAVRDGAKNRTDMKPIVRGDRSILERVASRDSLDRSAVEAAFEAGDAAAKRSMIEAALARPDSAPVDLLRLALHSFDPQLSTLARQGLAQANTENAADVINDALRIAADVEEKQRLIDALARIGESSTRARSLATFHQGLAVKGGAVDLQKWSDAIVGGGSYAGAAEAAEATAGTPAAQFVALENQARAFESADPAARLDLAEGLIQRAISPDAMDEDARIALLDAKSTALDAEAHGATGWRVNAVISAVEWYLGNRAESHRRAESAVAAGIPENPKGWSAMAVLGIFAQGRQEQIANAVRAKQKWPPQWLTDVHSAYTVLLHHPLATDEHVAAHYDFLRWFDSAGEAERILAQGLERFPESDALHARLRRRILAMVGADGLEPAYAEKLAAKGASPRLEWFAGIAAQVAAEYHRRDQDAPEALVSYANAMTHFERAIAADPERKDAADLWIALALAGRARIECETGDLATAAGDLLASFERKPGGAATQDGLNISPVDTAKMLIERARAAKDDALVERIQAALGALDPKMLELPAYEREPPSAPPPNGG